MIGLPLALDVLEPIEEAEQAMPAAEARFGVYMAYQIAYFYSRRADSTRSQKTSWRAQNSSIMTGLRESTPIPYCVTAPATRRSGNCSVRCILALIAEFAADLGQVRVRRCNSVIVLRVRTDIS